MNDVASLQLGLSALGRNVRVDDRFGTETLDRLREELPTATSTDAATLSALKPKIEARVQGLLALDRPLSRDEVDDLQKGLKALGFEPGPLDRVVGPITSKAAADFLKKQPGGMAALKAPQVLAFVASGSQASSVQSRPVASQGRGAGSTAPYSPQSQPLFTPAPIQRDATQRRDTLPLYAAPPSPTAPVSAPMPTGERTKVVFDVGHGTPNSYGRIDEGAVYYFNPGTGKYVNAADCGLSIEAAKKKGYTVCSERAANQLVVDQLMRLAPDYGFDASVATHTQQAKLGPGSRKQFEQRTHSASSADWFVSIHHDVRDRVGDSDIHTFVHRRNNSGARPDTPSEMLANNLSPSFSDRYRGFAVTDPSMHLQKRDVLTLIETGDIRDVRIFQDPAYAEGKARAILSAMRETRVAMAEQQNAGTMLASAGGSAGSHL